MAFRVLRETVREREREGKEVWGRVYQSWLISRALVLLFFYNSCLCLSTWFFYSLSFNELQVFFLVLSFFSNCNSVLLHSLAHRIIKF
jgi:hypothetical protein